MSGVRKACQGRPVDDDAARPARHSGWRKIDFGRRGLSPEVAEQRGSGLCDPPVPLRELERRWPTCGSRSVYRVVRVAWPTSSVEIALLAASAQPGDGFRAKSAESENSESVKRGRSPVSAPAIRADTGAAARTESAGRWRQSATRLPARLETA